MNNDDCFWIVCRDGVPFLFPYFTGKEYSDKQHDAVRFPTKMHAKACIAGLIGHVGRLYPVKVRRRSKTDGE